MWAASGPHVCTLGRLRHGSRSIVRPVASLPARASHAGCVRTADLSKQASPNSQPSDSPQSLTRHSYSRSTA
eukprot:364836-Chlamydomonas_euryale.AAC.2